jgi:hypothetical protein
MKLETQIDTEVGIRRHRVTGPLDTGAIADALRELRARPDYDPSLPALWDLRDAEIDVSAEEVRRLADVVAGLGRLPVRTALVVSRPAAYGLARMYDQLVESKAFREGAVFYSLEEALAWLDAGSGRA